MTLRFAFVLCVTTWCIPRAAAQGPTYWKDVRPALRKHCIACHNVRNVKELEVSGGLTLDSYDGFMKAARKPVVHPGKSADSPLLQRILSKDEDLRMPPGTSAVPEETVALLRRWIDGGAAEGKRPDDVVAAPATRRRKLDVFFNTTAVPPPGVLGSARPAPLQLALKVGPLAPVTAVAFSPDGKLLATGAYGRVSVWEVAQAKPVRELTNVLGAVNDLRFSPDGKLLAVAGGQPSARGDLRLFQTSDWKLVATLDGHGDVVAGVAFRPDGKKLASASFDKTVRVWDVAGHRTEQTLSGHSDFVYAVAYSPDGTLLASASKDRTVKLVEAATGKSRFTFSGATQDVLSVCFSRDGKFVLAGGQEQVIAWWNAATGERDRTVPGHSTAVAEICRSGDDKLMASGGGDGTVKLWDGGTGQLARPLTVGSFVYAVALSPDSRLAAAGSFDGLVRLFDAKTGKHLTTLLTVPASGWLALTPEGYASGSKELTESGQWRMAGQAVPAAPVWTALGKADAVVRAVRGETLSPPVFAK